MTPLRAGEIWAFRVLGSAGGSLLCLRTMLRGVSPSKGRRPVTISKRMAPSA